VKQYGFGTEDGPREYLMPGINHCLRREVDDRGRVIENSSRQVAGEIDGLGASLDQASGRRRRRMDECVVSFQIFVDSVQNELAFGASNCTPAICSASRSIAFVIL
jgi:hypothetical protein